MPDSPEISVVVPVRDEQETVVELERQLREALAPNHEIVFVDDGSSDQTWSRLVSLHDPGRVRLLKLERPSGKSAALMAGFAHACAPVVFTLDGDLQDDPAEIPAMLEKLEEGFDLVSGWKQVRHDPWHKVVASRVFNFVMRRMTGLELHDMNCGFKGYRAEVTRALTIYGDQHRFIPVFAKHLGYRVGEIPVRHRPRRHGRSKYGPGRLIKGFLDLGTVLLRTRFRDRPAHPFGMTAMAFLAIAVVLGLVGFGCPVPTRVAVAILPLAFVFVIWVPILLALGWVAEILLDRTTSRTTSVAPSIEEIRD